MKHVAFLVEGGEGMEPDIFHAAEFRKQSIGMPRLISHSTSIYIKLFRCPMCNGDWYFIGIKCLSK